MALQEHYVGTPYKGNKKAKVIDPIFRNLNAIMIIDSILHYERNGQHYKFYKLKYDRDDFLCHYYGEGQVELIDGDE